MSVDLKTNRLGGNITKSENVETIFFFFSFRRDDLPL